MRNLKRLFGAAAALVAAFALPASAAEVRVLSVGSAEIAVKTLIPEFTKGGANTVKFEWGPPNIIWNRIKAGETWDVVILSDSAMADLKKENGIKTDTQVRLARTGLGVVQAWHVAFFNAQQGEARYDPRGMQLRSAGRDFRPLDVIALVAGYDDGRLAQGRTADAIFVFDPSVQLGQPVTVTLAGVATDAWADVIPRVERERSAVWSRAAAARKP